MRCFLSPRICCCSETMIKCSAAESDSLSWNRLPCVIHFNSSTTTTAHFIDSSSSRSLKKNKNPALHGNLRRVVQFWQCGQDLALPPNHPSCLTRVWLFFFFFFLVAVFVSARRLNPSPLRVCPLFGLRASCPALSLCLPASLWTLKISAHSSNLINKSPFELFISCCPRPVFDS